MNVFILNTGRCGSVSFIKACQHIDNFSAEHESRTMYVGDKRLNYPPNHIEADNRLAWFLGRLDDAYGDSAFYVHLLRDRTATAQSFARRYQHGIIHAYKQGILHGSPDFIDPLRVCEDYYDTINRNIAAFLKDKSRTMRFDLESAETDFPRFWKTIGATGNLAAALGEWQIKHNATDGRSHTTRPRWKRALHKSRRVVAKFPQYLRQA